MAGASADRSVQIGRVWLAQTQTASCTQTGLYG